MAVQEAAAATAAAVYVDQSAAAADSVKAAAVATAAGAWAGFSAWYDTAAVTDLAEQIADLSLSGQTSIVGLFSEYVAQVTAMLRGDRLVTVPRVPARPIRSGVDPVSVHSRPAAVFRETYALLGDEQAAIERAIGRAAQLMETDAMLAARAAQMEAMRELEVTHYRRVLRPELSESGPCGLCVVAADQVYKIGDLLPLHGQCKCQTVEVTDALDVGKRLNREDLDKIYAAAGGTTAADLKRVRVTINEHGELGPVLSVRGQKFTGPDDLGAPADPNLLKDRLAKLQNVLDIFTALDQAGRDMSDPLTYQRQQIALSERRIAAA